MPGETGDVELVESDVITYESVADTDVEKLQTKESRRRLYKRLGINGTVGSALSKSELNSIHRHLYGEFYVTPAAMNTPATPGSDEIRASIATLANIHTFGPRQRATDQDTGTAFCARGLRKLVAVVEAVPGDQRRQSEQVALARLRDAVDAVEAEHSFERQHRLEV